MNIADVADSTGADGPGADGLGADGADGLGADDSASAEELIAGALAELASAAEADALRTRRAADWCLALLDEHRRMCRSDQSRASKAIGEAECLRSLLVRETSKWAAEANELRRLIEAEAARADEAAWEASEARLASERAANGMLAADAYRKEAADELESVRREAARLAERVRYLEDESSTAKRMSSMVSMEKRLSELSSENESLRKSLDITRQQRIAPQPTAAAKPASAAPQPASAAQPASAVQPAVPKQAASEPQPASKQAAPKPVPLKRRRGKQAKQEANAPASGEPLKQLSQQPDDSERPDEELQSEQPVQSEQTEPPVGPPKEPAADEPKEPAADEPKETPADEPKETPAEEPKETPTVEAGQPAEEAGQPAEEAVPPAVLQNEAPAEQQPAEPDGDIFRIKKIKDVLYWFKPEGPDGKLGVLFSAAVDGTRGPVAGSVVGGASGRPKVVWAS